MRNLAMFMLENSLNQSIRNGGLVVLENLGHRVMLEASRLKLSMSLDTPNMLQVCFLLLCVSYIVCS